MDGLTYTVNILYGWVELQERLWPTEDGWVEGQSRKRTVHLVPGESEAKPGPWSEWESTGVRIRFN